MLRTFNRTVLISNIKLFSIYHFPFLIFHFRLCVASAISVVRHLEAKTVVHCSGVGNSRSAPGSVTLRASLEKLLVDELVEFRGATNEK